MVPLLNTNRSVDEEHHIFITPDGHIIFQHDDDVASALHPLGSPTTRRASHVEPHPTRPGQWIANMTPINNDVPLALGPFNRRDEALAAEKTWLAINMPRILAAPRPCGHPCGHS